MYTLVHGNYLRGEDDKSFSAPLFCIKTDESSRFCFFNESPMYLAGVGGGGR